MERKRKRRQEEGQGEEDKTSKKSRVCHKGWQAVSVGCEAPYHPRYWPEFNKDTQQERTNSWKVSCAYHTHVGTHTPNKYTFLKRIVQLDTPSFQKSAFLSTATEMTHIQKVPNRNKLQCSETKVTLPYSTLTCTAWEEGWHGTVPIRRLHRNAHEGNWLFVLGAGSRGNGYQFESFWIS